MLLKIRRILDVPQAPETGGDCEYCVFKKKAISAWQEGLAFARNPMVRRIASKLAGVCLIGFGVRLSTTTA